MNLTLRDIYTQAAMLTNLVAANEAIDDDILNNCQMQLQLLLSTWSINPKIQQTRTIVTLATDGTTPVITLPNRPIRIHAAQWSYATSPTVAFNLQQIDEISYYQINFKQITTVPARYYWDHATSLTLFPTPMPGQLTLVLEYPIVLDVTALDTVLTLPPGYDAALVYSLATTLHALYGKADSAGVGERATKLVEILQTQNQRPNLVKQGLSQTFGGLGGASPTYIPLIQRP